MSLKHAILAILDLEKGTGYDIVKRFNSSIGHFWSSSHQQVYKELHKLHQEGLLDCENIKQEGKPDKKVYSLTEAGLESLADWVHEPARPYKIKDPLLIKLYAGRHASDQEMLKEFSRHECLHQETLEQYHSLEGWMKTAQAESRSKYMLPYMTLRLGILFEKAWLDWVEEVKELLENGTGPDIS